MNYIVFDLEWNQSSTGQEKEMKALPFEIIEIGAVKLNERLEIEGRFQRLVRPCVYQQIHEVIENIIHLKLEDLEKESPFPEVAEEFLKWCGTDYIFCSWGPLDLTELQRNMRYYRMKPLSNGPLRFYDVQKLFSIQFEDRKSRRMLEYAINMLSIQKNVPFHRAFGDAYYTAMVMQRIQKETLSNYSFDLFHLPQTNKEEIKVVFDDYAKYISREFPNKSAAFADREVMSVKCYLCRKNIKRKLEWFTNNSKHYYNVGYCDVHGLMKAKLRVKKSENGGVYIVKTMKFISQEEMEKIKGRMLK